MKRGGSLSFLVGTISNVLVMEIGWTDVGSGGYILVSCAHSKVILVGSPMTLQIYLVHKKKPEQIRFHSKRRMVVW